MFCFLADGVYRLGPYRRSRVAANEVPRLAHSTCSVTRAFRREHQVGLFAGAGPAVAVVLQRYMPLDVIFKGEC